MTLGIITGSVLAGSDVTLLARLRGTAGQLVTRASLQSIAWTASDLTAGTVAGAGTWTPATVIFDSLQQGDPRWTADSAAQLGPDGQWGYNFLARVPAATFAVTTLAAPGLAPLTAHTYQVDVAFTDVNGGTWRVSWQLTPALVYA